MTRVIHTGDTHLGYRQYHSPERRRDFLVAFRRVVEDAIAEEVDAVVHAGDLFHDRSPALGDVHGAITALRDLREAGVPFLAVVGNHERTRGGQWLDLFATLGLATRLGSEPTRIGDVGFYGLDFVPRSKRDDLAYDFAPHDAEFAALVAHGLFTPFNAEWNTGEVLSASPVDFDVMLLGDDHQPDTARVDGTWVTYCGSTERTSAAEHDERGYNIVAFDGERSTAGDGVSISRRGIETRSFVRVDVELSEGEGTERVRQRLREESLEDAVVVVSVDGEGEDLKPARIEEFASERGALVARVTDRRDIATAEIDAVHFTDPDAAVRERIHELGLSEAALAIDETVRGDVADSNVRSRVRESIEELLDEPGALAPGEPIESDVIGSPTEKSEPQRAETAEAKTDGLNENVEAGEDDVEADATDAETADHEATDAGSGRGETTDTGEEETADERASESEPSTGDGAEESEPGTDDGVEESTDGSEESAVASESGGSDGQVTMEDYL